MPYKLEFHENTHVQRPASTLEPSSKRRKGTRNGLRTSHNPFGMISRARQHCCYDARKMLFGDTTQDNGTATSHWPAIQIRGSCRKSVGLTGRPLEHNTEIRLGPGCQPHPIEVLLKTGRLAVSASSTRSFVDVESLHRMVGTVDGDA